MNSTRLSASLWLHRNGTPVTFALHNMLLSTFYIQTSNNLFMNSPIFFRLFTHKKNNWRYLIFRNFVKSPFIHINKRKLVGRYTRFICYIYSIIIRICTTLFSILLLTHCSVLAFCYVLEPIWELGLGAIMIIAIENANKSIVENCFFILTFC